MAQTSVTIKFGSWAKLNQAPGGEFRALNDTGYTVYTLYSATDLSGQAPTGDQIKAAWPIENGDYLQRVAESGVADAFVTFANLPFGGNSTTEATLSVLEP